jgi:hypothetical protein
MIFFFFKEGDVGRNVGLREVVAFVGQCFKKTASSRKRLRKTIESGEITHAHGLLEST